MSSPDRARYCFAEDFSQCQSVQIRFLGTDTPSPAHDTYVEHPDDRRYSMISRLYWKYVYGRARNLIVPGVLSAILFFANMWFFPTPYLHINGVDQVDLSAKPGDEIPVRVARFDSANGWWLTSGISAVFPDDSGAGIESEVVKKAGSEWSWENFAQVNKLKRVTVDGTLVIPPDLPSDGRTIVVDVVGVVNYLTIDSWSRDAEVADSLLVTLTDRPHSSATFKNVEQSIGYVSFALAIVFGSSGLSFLLFGVFAVRSERNTNRTLAYMRRTPTLLRDLRRLVDTKARRLPDGYWKPGKVKLDIAEFEAFSSHVMRERGELREVLDSGVPQPGLEHTGKPGADQAKGSGKADQDLHALEENFNGAYRDLTLMLKVHRRWYQFWYWA